MAAEYHRRRRLLSAHLLQVEVSVQEQLHQGSADAVLLPESLLLLGVDGDRHPRPGSRLLHLEGHHDRRLPIDIQPGIVETQQTPQRRFRCGTRQRGSFPLQNPNRGLRERLQQIVRQSIRGNHESELL